MNPHFDKVATLFQEALELPAHKREAFLERSCAGDPDLLAEVRSLLGYHREPTGSFRAAVQPVAADLLDRMSVPSGLAGGAMLGPYRLDRKLGEGGMGVVYLGTDTRLDRKIAIKVIGPAVARTAEARARCLREARSAAALSHSNIAAIYDVGETAESPWLVMEYIGGPSLRSILRQALDQPSWLEYASQIAAALGHAHSRGIIHRDVKPDNILIGEEGNLKVIDFGLARAFQDQDTSGTITQPDTFVGTLAYAAPELIAGGSASARSDVYSAGVVLYELACGEHPFAGLKGHALVSAIQTGSYPTCESRNPGISPAISSVIHRAMTLEPAARYKNGSELAAALAALDTAADDRPRETESPSLAVIDFENIGSSPEFDWLGVGMAESLSADLAKVRSIRVISRNRVVQSLRRLGSPSGDAALAVEIGRDIGARWILTGGYQKLGERVRVTVKLIDAVDGHSLAAEKLDGEWSDLFEVQDRAAVAALRALTARLGTTDEQKILAPETRDFAAYEHYVRGRRSLYEMQGKSLSAAIIDFEQAVRLDPDYALAYSGLGTAHALQFIRTSNPEDIQRASQYLERAIELDPELGEPYPWLANIRIRRNDPSGAVEAGRRGVELQPDLSEAHYFYGGTFYMLPEIQPGGVRTSIHHLAEAIRLEPRFHATWLVLGASLMFVGMHPDAMRILNVAVRKESDGDLLYPFVGARTLLAFAHTRAGSWNAARDWHTDSLKALRNNDHVYTSSFETLSACGLGEIEVREGRETEALTWFRRARRIIGESRRTVGSIRLLIRIDAGLAAAYARTGEIARAHELAVDLRGKIEALAGQTATTTFECSFGQLWLSLASAEIRLGNLDSAAQCLAKARESGWLDAAWLRVDPELSALRDHSVMLEFLDALDQAPPVAVPLPDSTSGNA